MKIINPVTLKWKAISVLAIVGVASSSLLFANNTSASAAAPNTQNQFTADMNGDGNSDLLTFDPHTGDWWVALSGGANGAGILSSTGFQAPSRWMSGFGIGTSKRFATDVNGDHKADLVTFDANTGDWWTAISNGATAFNAPSRWIKGHGVGSANQLMGDINGDSKADAVVFFNQVPGICSGQVCSGSWWAATANVASTGFDAPGPWLSGGHGVNSSGQYLADVNGDNKADAVVWSAVTGDWWVSNSDGVHFATGPNRWATGTGIGSSDQYVTDVNGDNKADLFLTNPTNTPTGYSKYGGPTTIATSNGGSFSQPNNLSGNIGIGVSALFVSKVANADSTDVVTFDAGSGDWWVCGFSNPNFNGLSRWKTGFGIGT